MRVTLILEEAPHAQATTQRTVEAGDLVIGRGAEADWRIDDPDMYVSRTHCLVTVEEDEAVVRDASRGGLFLDGAPAPLGSGNAAPLEHGMRMRLGDFVLRVELERPRAGEDTAVEEPEAGGFVWADAPAPAEALPRPDALPTPFDEPSAPPRREEANVAGFLFDDPVSLDPPSGPEGRAARPGPTDTSPTEDAPGHRDPFGLGGAEDHDWFGGVSSKAGEPGAWDAVAADGAPHGPERSPDADEDPFTWAPSRGGGAVEARSPDPFPAGDEPADDRHAGAPRRDRVLERPPPERRTPPREPRHPDPPAEPEDPEPRRAATAPPGRTGDPDAAALRAAFFRGLRFEPPPPKDAEAEMEAMGVRFRLLVEGLTALLRARALEKRSARVAQTVIGSADVNPLKFVAATEEAVSALAAGRGAGYLEPDAAIRASFRDLHDHERRKWAALQQALRRMVDRFDPEEIERELEGAGLLETLLAGGRGAKLWGLYHERYREIASAAEDRFLGEVGADFRDAYEGGDP